MWSSASHSPRRVAALAGTLIVIALAYHSIPSSYPLSNKAAQFLFFLPIAMASLWFGWSGGLLAAVASSIAYLPGLPLQLLSSHQYAPEQYGELLDFCLMGVIFGWLAGRERTQRLVAEKTAEELRITYQRLNESLDSLKRAARLSAVGQLAANLAHEIRNPLAAIDGAVDLLRSGGVADSDRDEFLGIIQKEAKRLARLLTEMLDYARPKKPEFSTAQLTDLTASVASLLSPMAQKSNVRIVIESARQVPPTWCDPAQIRQVLVNLVLNAIQAMPGGGQITISVYSEGKEVVVDVRDEGPGIPTGDLDVLFSPFYTTKKDGTGLGLAVAQRIMHEHGGQLRVGSNIPVGAAFSISIPLREEPK